MQLFLALAFLLTFPLTSLAFEGAVTEETASTSAENEKKSAAESGFEPETLVGLGKIDHGGYGGPQFKYTRVAGRDGILVGGRGGWLINHRFLLGGGGFGLVNEPRPSGEVDRELQARFPRNDPRGDAPAREWEMAMGYGGVFMEYLIAPSKLVHATAGILIGGGGINFYERDRIDRAREDELTGVAERDVSDAFFVVEPEVGVELNVVKFMRVHLAASYRIVTGIDKLGLSNGDVSGPAGALSLKFGKF